MKKTFSRILIALALSLTGLAQADNIKTNVTITNAPFNGGAVGLAITAPGFTGPLTGNVTGNVNGSMSCGRCFIGTGSLNSNVSQLQIWTPDALRMALTPIDSTNSRDWDVMQQGCGGFQVTNGAPTSYWSFVAPHFCEPATATATFTGTGPFLMTLTGITGSVGQGQIVTGAGIPGNRYIISGSNPYTLNGDPTVAGPVSVSLAAGIKSGTAHMVYRGPNINECCGQFAMNDGSTARWETPISVIAMGTGPFCCAIFQTGDMWLSKETDAGAAPGPGYMTMKMVAGTAGSCKLIVYGGTSTTPVTLADNIGSGC